MVTICWFKRKLLSCKIIWKKESQTHKNVEAFLRNNGPLAIKRYSYSDIKKMTNLFRNKLGEGQGRSQKYFVRVQTYIYIYIYMRVLC
jgi:hypothetical protein